MAENKIKNLLNSGKPAVGTWLALASPLAAEAMAHVGWDWLVVDMEHSSVDVETTRNCFMAMSTTETTPMARVPWNSGDWIKRVLDAGAQGLVVPMVNTREEAEAAVRWFKYPPMGVRSSSSARNAYSFKTDNETYRKDANDLTLVIVMIEHITGVENADEIMSVEGVDACFIGPNDLCNSMGFNYVPANPDPRFDETVQKIFAACKRNGKACGIHTYTPQMASDRIAQGFQFIALASEAGFMSQAATAAFRAVKR